MSEVLTEKTILIVGGTGTGKSGFLNNLALILRFQTLEEAENSADFVPLIPVKMEFNDVSINEGQDVNERDVMGYSRTRSPQIYRIKFGNVVFNIIDTPGMADSAGQQLDNEHVKQIATCLYQFKELNGIISFLKSSENTLNNSFRYTFNMIYSCLGNSAAKIISFGITHSNHNKNPGAAPNVIRKYLEELGDKPGIRFTADNTYCFESNPLFHLLSNKKGVTSTQMDRLVYSWTYKNNLDELLRFFKNVYHRKDAYNILNVRSLIMAKQVQPALVSLLTYLEAKDAEIKMMLDRMEKDILIKDSDYAKQETNLKQIRKWTEECEVTKTRMVNQTQKVKKERIVEEQYMDTVVNLEKDIEVNGFEAFTAGILALFGNRSKLNSIFQRFTQGRKLKPKVEQYVEEATFPVAEEYSDIEYRDRVSVEEDPVVRQILDKIEEERAKVKLIQSEKVSSYERIQGEKKLVQSLLNDLILYLEEHAIIGFDDSGLGSADGSTMDLSSCIEKLKITGQWNLCSKYIEPEEIIARLVAISELENFGIEIKDILSKCKNLEGIKYQVKNIQLEPSNVFMNRVLQGI